MEIRLLGSLEVIVDGKPVELRGAKPRLLLTALALRAGRVVPVDTLIDDIWGDAAPPSATASLQMHTTSVRRVVGRDRIRFEPPGYRLAIDPDDVDVAKFERLVDAGGIALRCGDPARAGRILQDALHLWRGDVLADVRFAEFAQAEIRRLEMMRISALEQRLAADLARGRHMDVLGELQGLVAEHPLHEEFVRLLVLCLWQAGHQAESLRAYDDARRRLVDEIGVEPGPPLQAAHQQVLNQVGNAARGSAATAGRRLSLPVPPTAIIGREATIGEVCRAVRTHAWRLQTITGPGGVGKTRLALACAAALDAELAGGCVFVDLTSVTAADVLISAVEEALGVGGGAASLADSIRAQTLVVLDNFEQLLDTAGTVASWLAATPELSLLITSRERFRVRGEHEIPLGPLADGPAVELFCERARDAGCGVTADDDVARVCAQVDNLPLAIELVASRVRLRPVAELAKGLTRRLDATTYTRDVPDRHRSVRATIEWSVHLLEPTEREAFARLSVLQTPFTVEEAALVVSVDEHAVGSLLDKSLLHRMGDGRFDMLATIREYAAEVLDGLGQRAEVSARHLDWITTRLAEAHAAYDTGREQDWLPFFVSRRADVDAALSQAADDDPLRFATMAAMAAFYWSNLGWLRPGLAWLDRALERLGPTPSDERARVQCSHGMLAWRLGNLDDAERSFAESITHWEGRPDAGADLLRPLVGLAHVRLQRQDFDEAESLNRRVEDLARRSGDEHHLLVAIGNLASISFDRGDPGTAAERYADIATVARARDDRSMEAWAQSNLGSCRFALGEHDAAWNHLVASLALLDELGWVEGVVYTLGTLAAIAAAQSDLQGARVLLTAADSLADSIGLVWQQSELSQRRRTQAAIAELGDMPAGEYVAPGTDPAGVVAEVISRGSRPTLGPQTS